ncbi:MAG: hypothetical protein IJZ36_00575 [Bacilli bacterium]|nr:hypothetical protein [Bacilli bacterium]
MNKRFVYPKILYGHRKCLQIQRETEDGQIWFGIEDAIKNYLEEYNLKIENIEWLIWSEIQNEYISIKAKNLNNWIVQFEQLDVIWKE